MELHNAHLRQIFQEAVSAVQPAVLIPAFFRRQNIDFEKYSKIYVAGAGKATAAMAEETEKILAKRIAQGLIAIKHGHDRPLQYIQQINAGHPLPDENSVRAADETIRLFSKARKGDLIIFLLSGGASSLLTDLPPGVSLKEYNTHINKLLRGGASIQELNAERKKLSAIKGGKLVKYASEAEIISLIISDVPGDDLAVIGSGPTYLEPGEPGNVHNYLIGNNQLALNAAAKKAEELGYKTELYPGFLTGDVEEAAIKWVKEIVSKIHRQKYCYIAGGETTVKVKGTGVGGRNQHFALTAAKELKDYSNITLLAAGTDGTDGPTDATGAIVDANTWSADAVSYLDNHDSYNFFAKAGAQLKTGPTQTNVMDIVITLAD